MQSLLKSVNAEFDKRLQGPFIFHFFWKFRPRVTYLGKICDFDWLQVSDFLFLTLTVFCALEFLFSFSFTSLVLNS